MITYWSPVQADFPNWSHDASDLVERDSSSRVVCQGSRSRSGSWYSAGKSNSLTSFLSNGANEVVQCHDSAIELSQNFSLGVL